MRIGANPKGIRPDQQSVRQHCDVVHIMRRHSRQGHLTSRLERIEGAARTPLRTRTSTRRLRDRPSAGTCARIIEERRLGVSMPTLSRKYGISDYSLRRFFAEAGMAPSRSSLTREKVERIADLADSGISIMEVSRRVGAPDSTVRLALARLRAQPGIDKTSST